MLLIFLTDAPLALLNLVAGVVYALAMPFVALTTTYLYFDARVHVALAPPKERTLPAEIEIRAHAVERRDSLFPEAAECQTQRSVMTVAKRLSWSHRF